MKDMFQMVPGGKISEILNLLILPVKRALETKDPWVGGWRRACVVVALHSTTARGTE